MATSSSPLSKTAWVRLEQKTAWKRARQKVNCPALEGNSRSLGEQNICARWPMARSQGGGRHPCLCSKRRGNLTMKKAESSCSPLKKVFHPTLGQFSSFRASEAARGQRQLLSESRLLGFASPGAAHTHVLAQPLAKCNTVADFPGRTASGSAPPGHGRGHLHPRGIPELILLLHSAFRRQRQHCK